MSQPYYDVEDDLSPSFKKLCIRNSFSKKWSIVPYRPINKQVKNTDIKEVLLHKKLKDSKENLLDNKHFTSQPEDPLILYSVKPILLAIEDATDDEIEDDIEENCDMCLD